MDEMKGTVIVYSRVGCKSSLQAKNTLASLGLPYLDISLDAFPKVEEQLIELIGGGVQTPQIFFNSLRVSGYRDLRRLVASSDAWLEIVEMLERGEDEDSTGDTSSITTSSPTKSEGSDQSNKEPLKALIPADFDKLMSLMRRANLIKDNTRGAAHRNSFKGEDFVKWIMREKQVKRSEALELGQALIDRHFGKQMNHGEPGSVIFSPDRFYLMNDDDPNSPINVVISNLPDQPLDVRVADINERICEVVDRIYAKILSADQRIIYFERLEDDDNFRRYLALVADLPHVNLEIATTNERTALFVNLYNMMLVHIVYKHGLPSNVWQRRRYFNATYYLISKHRYSLQSIYNGILRGNRRGREMLWKPFGRADSRRSVGTTSQLSSSYTPVQLITPDGNPLVHFALNTYSATTPVIRTYSVGNLTAELRESGREFLENGNLWVDAKRQVISVSEIFNWYAADFGNTQDQCIEWISEIIRDEGLKESLAKVYLSGQYTLNFLPLKIDSNFVRED